MNCIAINEEPAELNVIKNFCHKTETFNLVGSFRNVIEAAKELEKDNIDIVFLNIFIPEAGNLEFLKHLNNPPLLVFTNNSLGKSMNNLKTKTTGPQLKPLILHNPSNKRNNTQPVPPIPLNAGNKNTEFQNQPRKFLFVKVGCSTVKVRFDEIEYIEGLKDYVKIHTSAKSLVTKCTIKHIESKLPEDLFVRVHKSYLISIDRIDEIKYNHIFIGQKKIPIGMRFKDSFNEKINHLIL